MSSRIDKTYYCAVCGNEVKFTKDGGGTIVCCSQEMKIMKDENKE